MKKSFAVAVIAFFAVIAVSVMSLFVASPVVNVPVKILASIGTIIVITGINAFRNAWPNNTRIVELPFALANRM